MPSTRIGYEDTLKFTTSLCLSYTLLAVILRSWVRRTIYGFDDYIVAGVAVLAITHFACGYWAIGYGGGKPLSYVNDEAALSAAATAGVVTFTVAHYLSKCSVLAFLLRITKDQKQILLYRINIGVCAAIGVASVLLVTVGMPTSSGYYWNFLRNSSQCGPETDRWDVWTALDCITETALLLLPIYQVWGLQMPRSRKLTVVGAFWLRLPVLGLSIGRAVYTNRLCNAGVNVGLDSSVVMMWMQVELTYGIMATTFCALRAYTMGFNSNMGMGFVLNAGPESYTLSKMNRSGNNSKLGSSKLGSNSASQRNLVDSRYAADASRSAQSGADSKQPGHFTQVSAKWREGRSSSSERAPEDTQILRETAYEVQHSDADELPILAGQSRPQGVPYGR